jgi:hypothetical protein
VIRFRTRSHYVVGVGEKKRIGKREVVGDKEHRELERTGEKEECKVKDEMKKKRGRKV